MYQRLLAVALCTGAALTYGVDTGLALKVAGPEALVSAGGSDKYDRDETPKVAHDTTRDRYLVVWAGDMDSREQSEIHARLVDAEGKPASPVRVVSDIEEVEKGPGGLREGDNRPRVAYDAAAGQFLVEWDHCVRFKSCALRAKRLSSDGIPLGADLRPDSLSAGERSRLYRGLESKLARELRKAINPNTLERITITGGLGGISNVMSDRSAPQQLPPDDEGGEDARDARFVFHPTRHEIFVVYTKENGIDGGTDVYARRLTAGKPLSLSVEQVQSNQRIGQAALRRVNAIQAWLDAGLVRGDIRTESLRSWKLAADVPWTVKSSKRGPDWGTSSPRPLSIPRAKTGATNVSLTARQMRINQRIYSAALRRIDALNRRLSGQLTGGDIRDGTLDQGVMVARLKLEPRTPSVEPMKASVTRVKPAKPASASLAPTIEQLSVNRRIAQQAVRRANDLRASILDGLSSHNFANGSISAVDFAP